MSLRIEPVSGAVKVPDTVDELVTDGSWQAQCDQVRAALYRGWLPFNGGHVYDDLTAERLGGAR